MDIVRPLPFFVFNRKKSRLSNENPQCFKEFANEMHDNFLIIQFQA